MDVEIVDTDALTARDPSQIALYLRSRGWEPDSAPGGTVWQLGVGDERLEALVPTNSRMKGYAGFIRQLLHLLEDVEERSQLEIFRDISTAAADVQYVRTMPNSPAGTIPINDASKTLENIRQWVLAAAVGVASPFRRAVQPARKPADALEFMRGVRLGPSYEGSYIWSVEVPLPPRVGQEILPFDDPDVQYHSQPFPRRVSQFLYRATSRALSAAQLVVHQDQGLDAFTSGVNDGVTANLCESLAGLAGEEERPFQLSFQWAISRPVEPTPSIRFDPPEVQVLAQAAKEMRANLPEEDIRIIGNVVRLHRESSLGSGEVSIAGVMEGDTSERLWRVWVELTEQDYLHAITAHDRGHSVSVRGDLTRRGNRSNLSRVSVFEVLPDQSA
ncbi:hypothetical protein OG992_29080 [Micromonospora sp. NBC_00362]|uniref:hypothetical protein n=1 Tax=Micromonospora sp. NBC_00362 TaxID=2975975 RepID=UPI0022535D48|nr:hypothetical protein [Micromonospora sp. NBC_00362]MCX5121239.1 hypothetical protein [Micromonospora sp. NBC_00362]